MGHGEWPPFKKGMPSPEWPPKGKVLLVATNASIFGCGAKLVIRTCSALDCDGHKKSKDRFSG